MLLEETDKIDKEILDIIKDNSELTNLEISEKVDRSQPTIGIRLNKMKEKGLNQFFGIDITKTDKTFFLLYSNTDPSVIKGFMKDCKNIIFGFSITGKYNFLLFCFANSEEEAYKKADELREHSTEFNFEIVLNPLKKLIIPLP